MSTPTQRHINGEALTSPAWAASCSVVDHFSKIRVWELHFILTPLLICFLSPPGAVLSTRHPADNLPGIKLDQLKDYEIYGIYMVFLTYTFWGLVFPGPDQGQAVKV